MRLRHAFYLAARHLRAQPWRNLVLLAGVTLAAFLPLFTFLGAAHLQRALGARARATPIVVGFKGNEFDLTMSSLYFRGRVRDPITYATLQRIRADGYGLALPLHVRHTVQGAPLVGTDIEYFRARGLRLAGGRYPALLGEIVAGSEVGRRFGLELGDRLRSDLSNLYNLAGSYPLMLEVVGILEDSATADDEAFFADTRTAWAIDGLLHGHEAVTPESDADAEIVEPGHVEATAALFLFTEINDSNRDSFHLHGEMGAAPLSSVLVFPDSQRHHDQLLGDFALEETLQAIRPGTVLETIFAIVLRLQQGLSLFFVLVAATTIAFFVLVVSLSLRLRRREMDLMRRLGCARFTIATTVGVEIAILVAGALIAAAALTGLGLVLLQRYVPI